MGQAINNGFQSQDQAVNPLTAMQNGVSSGQVGTGLNNATNSLQQQQNFVNALNAQNGLGTQQSAISGLQGVAGQQQALAGQLQGVANGTGPNPALAQLRQNTNANNQMAAGTIASTKGLNPAIAAKMAGTQAVNNNQNAANQAASLSANQQLNAMGQLGQQQSAQAATQGAIGNLGNTQVANQAGGLNNLNQASQSLYATQLGGLNAQNATAVSGVNGLNSVNSQSALANQQQQGSLLGGLLGGVGSLFGLADGGEVPDEPVPAAGTMTLEDYEKIPAPTAPDINHTQNFLYGSAQQAQQQSQQQQAQANKSGIADTMSSSNPLEKGTSKAVAGLGKGIASLFLAKGGRIHQQGFQPTGMMPGVPQGTKLPLETLGHGGKVKAMLSPGEKYLSPSEVEKVEESSDKKKAVKHLGKIVPGKPRVKGDSEKNDIVPANLEPGGVVVKRTAMQSDDKAAKFVNSIMSHSHLKKKK